MIDYHRLKGNQTMAFWRFSLKGFARFGEGDLFFFIDKRARHPHTLEKGLVGYGRCVEIRNLSPKQTWDKYETLTGYNRYADFQEAVRYYRKHDKRLPNQLQTILLENVVFFQHPIFFSEVGIELNERLESFTYIEKNGKDASKQLLKIAKDIGLDLWMMSQNPEVETLDMDKDMDHQKIRDQLLKIETNFDALQMRILKNHTQGVALNQLYYTYHNQHLNIYLPLSKKNQLNALVGIKTIIETCIDYDQVSYTIITHLRLDEQTLNLLALMNLEHVQI